MSRRPAEVLADLRRQVDELAFSYQDEVSQRFVTRRDRKGHPVAWQDRTSHSGDSLIERLADLVEPTSSPIGPGGKHGRHRPASPAPVNMHVLGLLSDIHTRAIDFERQLRALLGDSNRPRGTSYAAAVAALRALPGRVERLHAAGSRSPLVPHEEPAETGNGHDRHDPGEVYEAVRDWHRAARDLLGFRQPFTPLRGHVCPYCEAASLRLNPYTERLECYRPSCRTPAGNRPSWDRDELGRLGRLLKTEESEANAS